MKVRFTAEIIDDNIKSIYYKKVARKMKVRFTAEIIDDNSSFQVLENLNTTD